MIAHAIEELPNECCGLFAGSNGRIIKMYRARNSNPSPTSYNVDPKELLSINNEIEDNGWELLGIYHSHPTSEAYPSATDVRLAAWPDAIYIIMSLKRPDHLVLKAFSIRDGVIEEEELEIAD